MDSYVARLLLFSFVLRCRVSVLEILFQQEAYTRMITITEIFGYNGFPT